ncbi:MAG: PepSY domain-containing protein [Oligoflexia bacterium]|nr:PepSY domain-containing protein [Oligoflexia bacterium]
MKSYMAQNLWLAVSFSLATISAVSAETPPKHVVGMEQARNTALKNYPGAVTDHELEKENGKWIYSFDIRGNDQKTHEVWIDARSGKMIGHHIESAAEESSESK